MPRLISLKSHDEFIRQGVADPLLNSPKPNGIACPKCGKELLDLTPNMILTSMPPQKTIICRKCGYKGTRLA